jgi:hypothetical protein
MADSSTRNGIRESGRTALAAIDRVLGDRPKSVQPACLALTHSLVQLRDALIAKQRTDNAHQVSTHLVHTNALLSLVFSLQYPLEGVHAEKLNQARNALAKLIAETADD